MIVAKISRIFFKLVLCLLLSVVCCANRTKVRVLAIEPSQFFVSLLVNAAGATAWLSLYLLREFCRKDFDLLDDGRFREKLWSFRH
jgi:hypothetical protein